LWADFHEIWGIDGRLNSAWLRLYHTGTRVNITCFTCTHVVLAGNDTVPTSYGIARYALYHVPLITVIKRDYQGLYFTARRAVYAVGMCPCQNG